MRLKHLLLPVILFFSALQSMEIAKSNQIEETVLHTEWRNPLFTPQQYTDICYINEDEYVTVTTKINTSCICNQPHSVIDGMNTKVSYIGFSEKPDKCYSNASDLKIAHNNNNNDILLSWTDPYHFTGKRSYKINGGKIETLDLNTISHEITFTPWSPDTVMRTADNKQPYRIIKEELSIPLLGLLKNAIFRIQYIKVPTDGIGKELNWRIFTLKNGINALNAIFICFIIYLTIKDKP